MATHKQRVLGALLGVHAGDALGATVEFSPWAEVRQLYPDGLRDIVGGGPFGWPAGHATDDTDLTRAVLLAYAECDNDRDGASTGSGTAAVNSLALAQAAARHMLHWYDGRWPGRTPGSRPVDAGRATVTGLQRFRTTGDVQRSGAGAGQAGNGSLMRCVATGLWVAADDADRLLQESALVSAITHNDGRCVLACAAYNVVVAALVGGAAPAAALAAGIAMVRDDRAVATLTACLHSHVRADVVQQRAATLTALDHGRHIRIAELATRGPRAAHRGRETLPGEASGYVLESLTVAVAAVLDDRPAAAVLVDVVRIGRDADTNAAIAGGLLGARDGVEAIPAAWRAKLQFADEFARIVDGMPTRGQVHGPSA